MDILVLMRMVPDLVEELDIAPDGRSLDWTFMRAVPSEFDEHALEQAILIKEKTGATVTVAMLSSPDAEDVLFSAAARGTDRLIKLTNHKNNVLNSHALARLFAQLAQDIQPKLILTGVQTHDSLDGALGALIAAKLNLPYAGYIAGVEPHERSCIAYKEYPGGLVARLAIEYPAVLGIQSADQPPRYVAISLIRRARQQAAIETRTFEDINMRGGVEIHSLSKPQVTERAEMLSGDEQEIADQLVTIFQEQGLL